MIKCFHTQENYIAETSNASAILSAPKEKKETDVIVVMENCNLTQNRNLRTQKKNLTIFGTSEEGKK